MEFRAARASHPRARRRFTGAAAAAVVAATIAFSPAAAASAGPDRSPIGASRIAAKLPTVDVMTRNLYLGASLDDMLTALHAGTPIDVLTQTTKTWTAVKASNPAKRMAAVADEIAEARPAVVGLQEVATWSTYPYDPRQRKVAGEPTVEYDFLSLLLKALAERGMTYHEVEGATSPGFTSPPIPLLPGADGMTAVQLADRDVILRRDDVETTNARHGSFETILSITQPEPLTPLPVDRGWGSADVQAKGATFRFVNADTEAWGPEKLRKAQVTELFLAQARVAAFSRVLPVVYVGGYDSAAADGGAYKLLGSVLEDAWVEANGSEPGYTCCQPGDLANKVSRLDERTDLVMTTRDIRMTSSYRTGTRPVDLAGDTSWASDHAGVVARLSFR